MITLLVAGWFVCGIAGLHLRLALWEADGEVGINPHYVWVICLGPFLLIVAILEAVRMTTSKPKK